MRFLDFDDKKSYGNSSPMYVAIFARLLGLSATILVLILTIKSELLAYDIITYQLVLAIPFLVIAMLSEAKIRHSENLKKYFFINKISSAFAYALIFNTLGLLVSRYVSVYAGILFFAMFIAGFLIMFFTDFHKRRFFHEFLIILLMILFGLLPTLELIRF